jgi:hypothetical protein
MEEFGRLGYASDFAKRNMGNRPGKASPAQVQKLRALWAQYTGGEGDDASLGKWLERQFGVSALRFLDYETAQRAIGGAIAMNKKKAAKAARGDGSPEPAGPAPAA